MGRDGSAPRLPRGSIGMGEILFSPLCLATYGRQEADLPVMATGELVLPPTVCSSQESRPCTLPRQHSKADPRVEGQVNW